MRETDIVIIGGGPAGMTAAIWCQRLGLDHQLVEAKSRLGGALFDIHNPIIDYPGSQTANGRELQALFHQHVLDLKCVHHVQARVQTVDVRSKILRVAFGEDPAQEQEIRYRGLILATGAAERRLAVPGEAEMIARGEVYSASRDRDRFTGRRVAVVGGGDRAFEGALLLAERGAEVVLIHRSDRFRARSEFSDPVLQHPRIQILTHATITQIFGEGAVAGIHVQLGDGSEKKIEVDALFVRIGVEPHSHLVRGQVETDPDGYILTDSVGQSNCPSIFAVGDVCTRPLYSSIASAVGQSMIAAKHLSLYLAQKGEEL